MLAGARASDGAACCALRSRALNEQSSCGRICGNAIGGFLAYRCSGTCFAALQLASRCSGLVGHVSSGTTRLLYRAMCMQHADSQGLCPPAYDFREGLFLQAERDHAAAT